MLLSIFTETWPYLVPFVASLLSLGVGYLLAYLNRAATETSAEKAKREKAAADADAGGEARLKALEKAADELNRAFDERKQTADQQRMLEKLNYDKDFATITEILKESAETTKQMVGILANISHLNDGQKRTESQIRDVNRKVDTLSTHILNLASDHAKRNA